MQSEKARARPSCSRDVDPSPYDNRLPSSCSTPFQQPSSARWAGKQGQTEPSTQLTRSRRLWDEPSPSTTCYILSLLLSNVQRPSSEVLRKRHLLSHCI